MDKAGGTHTMKWPSFYVMAAAGRPQAVRDHGRRCGGQPVRRPHPPPAPHNTAEGADAEAT
eukprot:46977-Eustigmatos_ZCMA.PRE.1